MTLEELAAAFEQVEAGAAVAGHTERAWQLEHRGARIQAVVGGDDRRVQIVTPIAAVDGLDDDVLTKLLEANFFSTDCRYALGNGLVWGVFSHRLTTLSAADLHAALDELAALALPPPVSPDGLG